MSPGADMLRVELGEEVRPGVYRWACRVAGFALEGLSSEPLLDACRTVERTGENTSHEIGLFREGRPEPALRCTVGGGAATTVMENSRNGPRFVKWRPFAGFAKPETVQQFSGSPS
jgi:hypothetical protein